MGTDADGSQKLKRARRLLGNDDINKTVSEKAPDSPAPPPPPPSAARSEGAAPPASMEAPSAPSPPPAAPRQQDAPPAPPPAAVPRVKATKIVDDQFHVEHVYETPETRPDGDKPAAPPENHPRSAVSTSASQVASEANNHPPSSDKDELIKSLPKTAWGVKVTMEDFIFIRDHDHYRLLFKDQRTFREKFVEWMHDLEKSTAPEMSAARNVTLNTRKATPGSTPEGSGGDSEEHL